MTRTPLAAALVTFTFVCLATGCAAVQTGSESVVAFASVLNGDTFRTSDGTLIHLRGLAAPKPGELHYLGATAILDERMRGLPDQGARLRILVMGSTGEVLDAWVFAMANPVNGTEALMNAEALFWGAARIDRASVLNDVLAGRYRPMMEENERQATLFQRGVWSAKSVR